VAIRFDTSGERLARTGPGAQSVYTIAGWFYLDTDTNAQQTLLGLLAGDFTGAVALGTAADGVTPVVSATGGGNTTFSPVPGTGAWFYLAATRTSAPATAAYIGTNPGVLIAGAPSGNLPAIGSTWQFILANALGVGNQLLGRAAFCRAWTAALTVDELEAEMQSATAVRTSGLWADWPFESNANDISGAGRHWTVTGSVSYVDQPSLENVPEIGIWEDITPFTIEDGFGTQCIACGPTGKVRFTYDYNGFFDLAGTKISSDSDIEDGTPWTLQPDPTDDDVWWANSGAGGGGGPLRSLDDGVTWTLRAAGSPTQLDDAYCIAIDPNDPAHILVAWHYLWSGDTPSGISETFDYGASWTNHPAGDPSWATGHAVFFTPGGAWLVATQTAGVWRKEPAGSWVQVETTSMTHGATQCCTVVGTTMYLALEHGIAVSTDDGETWTDISTGLDTGLYYSCVATDGTNLFTGGSFPVEGAYNTGTISWYWRTTSSGPWVQLLQSDTMINGPRQWAYDGTNIYAACYHGGIQKFTPTSSGPITGTPGVLTETDSLLSVGRRKRRAPAFASETDSMRPVGRRKRRTLVRLTEADSLLSVARRKRRTIGVAAETDSLQPVTRRKVRAVGVLLEVDTLQPVGVIDQIVAQPGTLTEADTLQPVTRIKRRSVGVLLENDALESVGRRKLRAAGILVTNATMQAVTAVHRRTLGLLQTAATLLPAARRKTRAVGVLTETDELLGVTDGSATVGHPGTLLEADELRPVGRVKRRSVGVMIETASLQPCTRRKQVAVGLLSETSSIRPVARSKVRVPGVIVETDQLQAVARSKVRSVGLLTEIDQLLSLIPPGPTSPTFVGALLLRSRTPERTLEDRTSYRTLEDITPSRTLKEVHG
jgi:hypothetical protein